MFRFCFLLLICCSFIAASEEILDRQTTYTCVGTSPVILTNPDGTKTCSTFFGTASTGYPIYKNIHMTTGVVSYVVQTGVNSSGQPIYSPSNQYGQLLSTTSTTLAPTTCAGTIVPNIDGTRSCSVKIGVTASGLPIYKVTHMTTGAVSYMVQTGTSSTGQPIYSPSNQSGQLLTPTASCSGTLVTNNDGSRSCVVRTGTCSTGYPIYQVTNVNTQVVTYVSQTGVSSTGQAVMTVTNQYCQPLAG
ncbi:uncharacterized protein LOC130703759 [Daphnia carinata]|uniref:uncharacterized protein LOC130703759 n=1 Tax=Daphnia carinata TaxID=120202 RepID=UPI00257A33B5|nr:uncharacterized protein LOC130703759 [Daphnia carinata]